MVGLEDLDYAESNKDGYYVATYYYDDDLVCTIRYSFPKYSFPNKECKLYIDTIFIEPEFRNQKLSKPILQDFIRKQHVRPVCLQNRIGQAQYPFPKGASNQTKRRLESIYTNIGFHYVDASLPERHPDYREMILAGNKRKKTRKKTRKKKIRS